MAYWSHWGIGGVNYTVLSGKLVQVVWVTGEVNYRAEMGNWYVGE